MRIYISTREKKCADKEAVEITKGNIIYKSKFYNYRYQYHSDYVEYSIREHPANIVNTRFDFGKDYKIEMYSNLNYFQRTKLNFMCRKTWIQQETNYKWVIGIVFGYVVGKFTR